jgi:hypothetical protein
LFFITKKHRRNIIMGTTSPAFPLHTRNSAWQSRRNEYGMQPIKHRGSVSPIEDSVERFQAEKSHDLITATNQEAELAELAAVFLRQATSMAAETRVALMSVVHAARQATPGRAQRAGISGEKSQRHKGSVSRPLGERENTDRAGRGSCEEHIWFISGSRDWPISKRKHGQKF